MPSLSIRWLALLAVAGAGFAPDTAHARDDGDKKLCVSAYEGAQRSRKQGELLAAREKLRFCASKSCPEPMHPDCEQWLREVEDSLPSLVVRVRSNSGEPLHGATLSLDGGDEKRSDGRSQSLDPGEHQVTVSAPGFEPVTRTVLLVEGSKLQEEIFTLVATSPPVVASAPAKPGPSSLTIPRTFAGEAAPSRINWVVPLLAASGLGVAGGGGFVFFGLRARSGDQALGSCSPTCSRADVEQVKRDYLFANVSLGAGIVGALATGTLLILRGADSAKPSGAARSTLRLGATTTWTTTF